MPDATTQPNVLFVVMHGLISLVDRDQKGFTAYILDMKDNHRYIYGDFLAEFTIPPRNSQSGVIFRATLQGVNSGVKSTANTLDPHLNVIVSWKDPQDTDPRIRGIINLPRPEEIFYFVRGELTGGVLTGNGIQQLKTVPTHISSIRVFKYSAPKLESILLTDDNLPSPKPTLPLWSGQTIAVTPGLNVAVLHIYDEPDAPLLDHDQHAIDEFKLGVDLLNPGLDLKITRPAKVNTGNELKLLTPDGLLETEVTDLVSRVVFSRIAITKVREGSLIGRDTGGTSGEVCTSVNG